MGLLELMSWIPKEKRWQKKYRGKRYAVSPRQLKTAPTKEASRQAANDWWDRKQREIDEALGVVKQHPVEVTRVYETAMENHRLYARWQRKYGDCCLAEKSEAVMEWLDNALKSDNPPYPLEDWQYDPLNEAWKTEQGFGMWIERINQILREEAAETAVPKENTIRGHIDQFLATLKTIAMGKGKLGTYETSRYRVMIFRKWCDPLLTIDKLDEHLWERFSLYLFDQVGAGTMAAASMAGAQREVRAFIRDRYRRRFCELPRNLTARNLSAQVTVQDPITFTVKEVKAILEASSERKRLWWLLMLNTGMYPSDLARLTHDEVDWKAGRIRRKRSKTRDRSPNVPKVDYKLWKETFALLKKYRSEHPTLVLLNEDGNPLWREVERNGRIDRDNNLRTAWFQLLTEIMKLPKEQRKPLKSFRKTPSTMLQQSKYGRFAEHFLGEAPHSVTAKHYAHENGAEFDRAVRWLGSKFGIK